MINNVSKVITTSWVIISSDEIGIHNVRLQRSHSWYSTMWPLRMSLKELRKRKKNLFMYEMVMVCKHCFDLKKFGNLCGRVCAPRVS